MRAHAACHTLAVAMAASLVFATSANATLPGRNGSLAFSAFRVNEESSDILIDAEYVGIAPLGGRARHLVTEGGSPAFSPDGRTLAYERSDYHHAGIWLTRPVCRWRGRTAPRAGCRTPRRLTRGSHDDPRWSPRGTRIAFSDFNTGRISTMATDGTNRRFVAKGYDPDWSSKGEIAFVHEIDGQGGIRVTRPGRHRSRVLTSVGFDPSWSPSGDRLAFVTDPYGGSDPGLHVINADGTGLREIWSGRTPEESSGESEEALSPAWSPDGRVIAFVRGLEIPYTGAVLGIRPDGHGLRVLARPPRRCRDCFGGLQFDDLAWQRLARSSR